VELLRKAENLTKAYALFDPDRPLEREWLERFYADRPEEASIASLMDGLLLDPSDDDKTILDTGEAVRPPNWRGWKRR